MVAVLEDAINCFQKYALGHDHWEKRLFQEVEERMLKKNSEWLYSFENICETLQLNADYIRKGLRVWKEANLKSDSVEDQRKDHTKLARTRVAPNVAQLSKTAQILMREYHLETSGAIDSRTGMFLLNKRQEKRFWTTGNEPQ